MYRIQFIITIIIIHPMIHIGMIIGIGIDGDIMLVITGIPIGIPPLGI
jgi:hypothetical protein